MNEGRPTPSEPQPGAPAEGTAPEAEVPRCDVCGEPVVDDEDPGDDPFRLNGSGLYVWWRGGQIV